MPKQELYERSPIRAFDEATSGGLKGGEMGLVTSQKGLGSTSSIWYGYFIKRQTVSTRFF